MKKAFLSLGLVIALVSCSNNGESTTDKDHAGNSDKPAAIDTTQHGTGITNQNVISTDTAAMSIDSFQKRK